MKVLSKPAIVLISALIAIADAAFGAQPPDVVQSDSGQNTAMGSFALLNLTTGTGNTAAGISALQSNTTGINNVAYGGGVLQSNTTGSSNTASGILALSS